MRIIVNEIFGVADNGQNLHYIEANDILDIFVFFKELFANTRHFSFDSFAVINDAF